MSENLLRLFMSHTIFEMLQNFFKKRSLKFTSTLNFLNKNIKDKLLKKNFVTDAAFWNCYQPNIQVVRWDNVRGFVSS